MPVGLVGAGDPGAARSDQWVDEVAHADVGEQLRTDVAADELRLLGEVVGVGLCDLDGLELPGDALEIDLTVAGHTDDEELPVARTWVACLEHDVLQRVGAGERAAAE